ncbi:MAG: outer membrane protein transport protein [Acidobacteriota bacterium]
MLRARAASRFIALSAGLLFFPSLSLGQLVLGQYENEAPLGTWNIFGLVTAANLGRGETMFTSPSDCSVALLNPALLVELSGFSATLSGSTSSAALYRYSVVNTGVLSSSTNLTMGVVALDFAGVSLSYSGWAVAASASLAENYDRPQAYVEQSGPGFLAYNFDFRQEGFLRNFNLSLARQFGRAFRLGLGFNFVRGKLERRIRESFVGISESIVIADEKTQDFSGFYLNVGIASGLTDKLDVGLVFRTPYFRQAKSSSGLHYSAPLGGTDIRIEAESSDRARQPWIIGAGAGYKVSARLRVLSDVTFFEWSKYEVEYFGETAERNFRDTFKVGLGAEYDLAVRLLKRDAAILLRAGVNYDPQPMREPRSAYTHFSAGAGLRWGMLLLDLGGSVGRESGSGNRLEVKRLMFSAGLRL